MNDLAWRPAFERTGFDRFELLLPQEKWTFKSGGVGGHSVSAAGIPEAYMIREDQIAVITLRAYEHEIVPLLAELRAIRNAATGFTFAFDQTDAGTEFDVYLHAPTWPEEVAMERDPKYEGTWLTRIEVRTTDGAAFDVLYRDTTPA